MSMTESFLVTMIIVSAMVGFTALTILYRTRSNASNPIIDDIQHIIMSYESDTFSASDLELTEVEARLMTHLLISRLIMIISQGGDLTCDGYTLSSLLNSIRDD